ncbi:MAG: hypothetical protein WC668_03295 [Patescibacteria group bacterium]|jgi:hypothetical protein
MPQEYLNKLKSLPPTVKDKLSTDEILDKLDALDEKFGIKSTSLVVSIFLGEVTTDVLADKLKIDYGFNDFLAHQVANGVREVVNEVGYYGRPAGKAPVAPSLMDVDRKFQPEALNKPKNSTVITFSREDEEEIKKYTQAVKASPRTIDYTEAATSIVLSFGYPAADEVMVKRLGSIIIARLKDVRDEMETKENLMKSRKVGGMDFSEADADRMLKIIKAVAAGPAGPVSPAPASGESPDDLTEDGENEAVMTVTAKPQANSSALTIEMEDGLPVIRIPDDLMVKPRDDSEILEKKIGLTPLSKTIKKETQLPPSAQDVKLKVVKDLPLPQPQPFATKETLAGNLALPRPTSRPNLDDVKFNKKLMGPIEELENMTLIDFRRLSPDPKVVTAKLKEKIDLLEKEYFGKKIEGIAAWHKNEVSKFYRLLGQAAMAEGKDIEMVIKERLTAGKPTLSLDEFHAVMELNRNLRY